MISLIIFFFRELKKTKCQAWFHIIYIIFPNVICMVHVLHCSVCLCVCVSNFSYNMWQECDTCQEGSDGSNLRLPATKHSARGRWPQLRLPMSPVRIALLPVSSRISFAFLALLTWQSFQISGSVSPLLWISCTKALRVSRELGLMNGSFLSCANPSSVLRQRLLRP